MSKQTESFYNTFSIFYPLADVFLRAQKKVLFKETNDLPEGNLLEIGVGNGSHFKFYKKHCITGIDTSGAMLELARKQIVGNIRLLKMDGKALLFDDGQFDSVVISRVIAVVDDPGQLMAEVLRVLKPQGQVFILNHFTPDNWLRFIDHAFKPISKFLHFKSVFHVHDIPTIKKFRLLKEVHFGFASYFKLLIYQKK
ncbi:class I SAM-dependent methyltransferase [Mucilaginibacter sp. ZT4R22]|uniref:Class I SAM-dependent methyltransferase n=1 Tax=Mucilaginibacter pankratovii TaxID=2772110 RepID=A0ABR7WX16_9SPHI|nr:class I SAM-dependent methyltransferase [Mucilaginibacter pankratovii]MBD1365974.1 class I SAM-dependent methyltransferase [Mucilaginibacter pankratovii]